ncbi:hypothetical protein COLSTE_01625 [Collinsella stercoris DSM 13279]|uniref:Uncharacterized protein n=1 Tax=Collinsella stercoris DSM 13279 TaxID=445975 RepID=B6GC07_9ACTN|nr:hypothetical protein COLSTE_01625 [Collinsella stercoris DSM 13279]
MTGHIHSFTKHVPTARCLCAAPYRPARSSARAEGHLMWPSCEQGCSSTG